MRNLFGFAKTKIKGFLIWVWNECKDWRTFALLVGVCLVVGLPVWGGYLLGLFTDWDWAYWMASALLAFWWLPGAPYFAVCIAITLAIKRFFEKRRNRPSREDEPIGDDKEPPL